MRLWVIMTELSHIELKLLHPQRLGFLVRRFLVRFIPPAMLLCTVYFINGLSTLVLSNRQLPFEELTNLFRASILILGIIVAAWTMLEHLRYRYQVRDGSLLISRGIIFRSETSVPLGKITDISLRSGWAYLLFGTCDLVVMTPAGSHGGASRIEGLSKRSAMALRHRLMRLMRVESLIAAKA